MPDTIQPTEWPLPGDSNARRAWLAAIRAFGVDPAHVAATAAARRPTITLGKDTAELRVDLFVRDREGKAVIDYQANAPVLREASFLSPVDRITKAVVDA